MSIKGKINHVGVGNVVLEQILGNNAVVVDTMRVKSDGTFSSDFIPAEPGYFRFNFYNLQFVTLLLSDQSVEVNVDGDSPNGWFEIKGSPAMNLLNDINMIIKVFNEEASALDESYREAYTQANEARMQALREDFSAKQVKLNLEVKDKIRAMGNSVLLIQAVNYLDSDSDFAFVDSVAYVVESDVAESRIKKEFIERIEKLRKLAIGSQAPEIELPDPDGNPLRLSSFRGKYVLIDFWAAWCGPCRREMPNVVRMYQKYGGGNFEIFGVSLDRRKEDWLKAIQDDGLKWPQVSDLQYFNSEAARDYNIDAIPATYLIDREGKIIDKNLRGKALEDKLAEIFGS